MWHPRAQLLSGAPVHLFYVRRLPESVATHLPGGQPTRRRDHGRVGGRSTRRRRRSPRRARGRPSGPPPRRPQAKDVRAAPDPAGGDQPVGVPCRHPGRGLDNEEDPAWRHEPPERLDPCCPVGQTASSDAAATTSNARAPSDASSAEPTRNDARDPACRAIRRATAMMSGSAPIPRSRRSHARPPAGSAGPGRSRHRAVAAHPPAAPARWPCETSARRSWRPGPGRRTRPRSSGVGARERFRRRAQPAVCGRSALRG